MLIHKLIIITVVVCLVLSVLTKGLLSASFDICAFTLLMYYLFKQKTTKH